MNRPRTGVWITIATLLLSVGIGHGEPIKVYSANPHYFMRDGKPIVLVTSDHHYGAIIDADFDYALFLNYLAANDMNLTRIYPGAMFEPQDKFAANNPLGPRPGRHILPWMRSAEVGANAALAEPGKPSFKFDLDRWNPEYFARLKAFVDLARKKGLVVEVAFFNGMYADCWPLMPFYHANNIQGVGRYEAADCGIFTTCRPLNQDVLRYQRAYVAKITTELNVYDNVIYDLCDEPSLQGRSDGSIVNLPDSDVTPWLCALKDAFLEAETALPNRHILGQTVQNLSPDLSLESWCAWLPTEYVSPAARALEKNYSARKPLVNVESDYFGCGLVKPYGVDDVRLEGWWFLLSGGAGVINLNGEYHRGQESGSADTRNQIVPQRRVLKNFVDSLDLTSISRFTGLGRFRGAVDFNIDRHNTTKTGRPGIDGPGRLQRINRLHNIKNLQGLIYLVGLQVPDQMPPDPVSIRPEGRSRLLGLLHIIMPNIGGPGLNYLKHFLCAARFGGNNDGDAGRYLVSQALVCVRNAH